MTTVPTDILKLKELRGDPATTDCTWRLLSRAPFSPSPNDHPGRHAHVSNPYLNPITAVNFSEFDREPSGKVNLIGRVK